MDAQIFWKVIGAYNMDTRGLQIVLLLVLLVMFALSYTQKAPWAAKFALGIANLWIGLAFFARYGSEPIQKYFALPLYLLFGILFLYESRHNGADTLQKPTAAQALPFSTRVRCSMPQSASEVTSSSWSTICTATHSA